MTTDTIKQAVQQVQQHHYLATDYCGWASANSADKALKLKLEDTGSKKGTVFIYRVPLQADAAYTINWFRPQVHGSYLFALYSDGKYYELSAEEVANHTITIDAEQQATTAAEDSNDAD